MWFMTNEYLAIVFVIVLSVGMVACFDIGQRLGARAARKEGGKVGLGAI